MENNLKNNALGFSIKDRVNYFNSTDSELPQVGPISLNKDINVSLKISEFLSTSHENKLYFNDPNGTNCDVTLGDDLICNRFQVLKNSEYFNIFIFCTQYAYSVVKYVQLPVQYKLENVCNQTKKSEFIFDGHADIMKARLLDDKHFLLGVKFLRLESFSQALVAQTDKDPKIYKGIYWEQDVWNFDINVAGKEENSNNLIFYLTSNSRNSEVLTLRKLSFDPESIYKIFKLGQVNIKNPDWYGGYIRDFTCKNDMSSLSETGNYKCLINKNNVNLEILQISIPSEDLTWKENIKVSLQQKFRIFDTYIPAYNSLKFNENYVSYASKIPNSNNKFTVLLYNRDSKNTEKDGSINLMQGLSQTFVSSDLILSGDEYFLDTNKLSFSSKINQEVSEIKEKLETSILDQVKINSSQILQSLNSYSLRQYDLTPDIFIVVEDIKKFKQNIPNLILNANSGDEDAKFSDAFNHLPKTYTDKGSNIWWILLIILGAIILIVVLVLLVISINRKRRVKDNEKSAVSQDFVNKILKKDEDLSQTLTGDKN